MVVKFGKKGHHFGWDGGDEVIGDRWTWERLLKNYKSKVRFRVAKSSKTKIGDGSFYSKIRTRIAEVLTKI